MSLEELNIMFAIIFGICAVISLISVIIIKTKQAEIASCPINEQVAKIVDMENATIGIVNVTRVLFEFEDKNRVRLTTEQTNDYMVGDEGLLKYQGIKLISFERGIYSKNEQKTDNNGSDLPLVSISVTQDEIAALMREEGMAYGEAMLEAKKRKLASNRGE